MQTGGTGDAKRTYFPSRKWKESRSAGRRIRHRGNITFSYDSLGIGDKEREMCWEESYSRVTKREKNKKKTHTERTRIKTTFYQMKIDDRAQRVTFRGKSLRFSIPLPITVFRERALERRNTFFFNSLSLCSLLVPSSSSLHSIEPVVVFALLFHSTFKKKRWF